MSNLLPQENKKALRRMYRMRFSSVIFLIIAGLTVVGSALLLPALFLSQSNEAVLKEKRDTLVGHETSELQRSLARVIGDINSRLAVFVDTKSTSPVLGSIIDPILSAQTANIHIASFSSTTAADKATAKVEVLGSADTREALLSFADRLRAVPGLTEVNVPITSFIKDENVTFTISLTAALK